MNSIPGERHRLSCAPARTLIKEFLISYFDLQSRAETCSVQLELHSYILICIYTDLSGSITTRTPEANQLGQCCANLDSSFA